MRDLRDPIELGELYLEMRGLGVTIERAVTLPSEKYRDGQFISANPKHHHSKTPQTIDLQEPCDSSTP